MITGVVLARNESPYIADCLRAFRPHVDQLILIDMESEDDTRALAKPLVDLILDHPRVPNFDVARNISIGHSRFEWLWFLDADERVRPETARLVRQIIAEHGAELAGIEIPFQTYFAGQWIHGPWWPGYTMPRVLKRGHFQFREELHSGVQVDGQVARLPPDPQLAIQHFSYRSVEHYVEKFNRYTSGEALNLAKHGQTLDWREAVRAMTRDLWLYYERNNGRQDGMRGWIIAWLAGQYRWFSHAKLSDLPEFEGQLPHCAIPRDLDEVLAVMEAELARLRGQRQGGQWSVQFRSPLFDPSGYADDGRVLLKSLATSDRHVTAQEIAWSDSVCALPADELALYRALLRGRRQTPSISVTNCIVTLCEPDPAADFNVLRTTFETDRIPGHWLERLRKFDEIWVCARHNATAFRRSGVPPEKIRILPGFVDTATFTPDGPRLELPAACQGRFVFLSVFDWQLRKGWDGLLRAYVQEFSVSDGRSLLLKITRSHGYTVDQVRAQADQVLASLGSSLDTRPDIVLWPELLEPAAMSALYRSADAFVLASRGEGWGRPYMEAMATGLLTIGTRGSGNEDFMHASNSLLVETSLVAVSTSAAAELPIYEGHQWHEPDEQHLRECLRAATIQSPQSVQLRAQALHDMRTLYSTEAAQKSLHALVTDIEDRRRMPAPPAEQPEQICIRLEGELFAGHSFSNINEQLALRLSQRPDVALSIDRKVFNPTHDAEVAQGHLIRPLINRPLPRNPHVVIRHSFPPVWDRDVSGPWVHIQPWEFGSLPRDWVPHLLDGPAEIWAPSNYVKDVYVRSGIPSAKIQVIPWGVDAEVYRPDVPPLHLPFEDCFRFLYVGGTVERKGFDVLLRAFREEFTADEPVALVIKDVGTQTFYRYGNGRQQVLDLIAQGTGPKLVYLEQEMTDGLRASLYAACHCLAAPYRGEGFGLPVLEAMAAGLPPIVPQGGATDDFVTDDTGYRLRSSVVETCHDWRLCGPATELSIDLADLRTVLRQAYVNRQTTREKGQRASDFVRREFSWDRTIDKMASRFTVLASGVAPMQQPKDEHSAALDRWADRPDLSACLVTQNMDGGLGSCLSQVRPWVREIVVHDLGSTDRTLDVAREYGARITIGGESDHRGAMRNTAVRRATCEWILSLDGDEFVEETQLATLARILKDVPSDVLGLRVHVSEPNSSLEQNGWHGQVRVFRNRDGIVFECRDAERVTPSIQRLGGRVVDVPLTINRRSASDAAHRQQLSRLHQDLVERDRDAESLWSLGIAHALAGDFFHAESFLHDCFTAAAAAEPLHREALALLVECYRRTGDPYRAAECAAKLQSLSGGAS